MKLRLIMTLSICFTANSSHASFLARIRTASRIITPIPTRPFATLPITTKAEHRALDARLAAAKAARKLAKEYQDAATQLTILAFDLSETTRPIDTKTYLETDAKINLLATDFRAELGTARYAAMIAHKNA